MLLSFRVDKISTCERHLKINYRHKINEKFGLFATHPVIKAEH